MGGRAGSQGRPTIGGVFMKFKPEPRKPNKDERELLRVRNMDQNAYILLYHSNRVYIFRNKHTGTLVRIDKY